MQFTHGIRRLSLTIAAGAAAALPAAAPAQPTLRLADDPFLGRISGGAAVLYELDGRAAAQSVAIAGRSATVKLVDPDRHQYGAFVSRPGLRPGGSYLVTIRVKDAGGTRVLLHQRLYLHRSLNRPRVGD